MRTIEPEALYKHRTSFPGLPAQFTANFHCQKGCKNGFAIGHAKNFLDGFCREPPALFQILRVDDKAQPNIDFRKDSLLPTQRAYSQNSRCQPWGIGCPQDPALLAHHC